MQNKGMILEIIGILNALIVLIAIALILRAVVRDREETTTTVIETTVTESTTITETETTTEITTTTIPETEWTVTTQTIYVEPADVDSATIDRIAGICYGEARGSEYAEICKVVWCICNRADAWEQSLWEVATAPNQFYYVGNVEYRDIVIDVLERWQAEKNGEEVYRELGPEYLWFTGDGQRNYFRTSY